MAWLILGGIASGITLLGVVWVVLGTFLRRPRIRLNACKRDGREGTQILGCEVINDPIYFGPLRMLGVKRSGFDEVSCLVWIIRAITNDTIVRGSPAAWHDRGANHSYTEPLPASAFGLFFMVATMDSRGIASANDEGAGVMARLAPDTYICKVWVHADELHSRIYERQFLVGVDDDCFEWIEEDWAKVSA